MQYDREKLKAVILYACAKCERSNLGAVKMHKILYYTDMIKYATEGSPITGAKYRKRPFGPTCDVLLHVLPDMARDGLLSISTVNYFGYEKKEYVSLVEPDTSTLSSSELSLLDEVIEFVCNSNTARTISEFSHARPWEMVEFGAEIPYRSAYNLFPTEVSEEAVQWAACEMENIASAGSKDNTLGYEDFAAFRSRVLQTGSRI